MSTHSSQFTSEADMEQQKGDKNNDSDDNQDLSDHTPYLEDEKTSNNRIARRKIDVYLEKKRPKKEQMTSTMMTFKIAF